MTAAVGTCDRYRKKLAVQQCKPPQNDKQFVKGDALATLQTLVTFDGTDGAYPYAGVTIDADGNLFGTTYFGGLGFGVVYEVPFVGGVYLTTPLTLVQFDGTDFAYPYYGNLIIDNDGNLLGTTISGGSGYGTVFQIASLGGGSYANTPSTIATFSSYDGIAPHAALITDANGNLYSTTYVGGASNLGTVFRIDYSGGVYSSTPTTLLNFDGANGQQPETGLWADGTGDLFGTTFYGGASGKGAVFKLDDNGDGTYTQSVIASFDGANGQGTYSSVIGDANGNLFGTTYIGGLHNHGTVFELINNGDGTYTFDTLYDFDATNGSNPMGGLIMDAEGSLYGTTYYGGTTDSGVIYKLTYNGASYSTTPVILAEFDGAQNASPTSSLTVDGAGNLYGTTYFTSSGGNGYGTVYRLSDTGFAICYLRGTHILTPTGEVCVEDLRIGDLVVTRFGGIQPIKWIGRQAYGARLVRNDLRQIPVRICAGALGDRQPARDLYISPGHSMLVDGTLVIAKFLVNGVTITQDWDDDDIHYFQIELETHDCVIAEGVWSETYADGPGLREQFHNVAEFATLYPDHSPPDEISLCAPRPERGAKLDAVLRPIVARASAGLPPGKLQGHIDLVSAPWTIEGWALDADNPELPVLLDVLIGDRVIGTFLACDYRSDLADAGLGRGRCAFFLKSPVRLRPETLGSVRIRRASDHSEIFMTPDCIAALEGSKEQPQVAGLRLFG